MRQHPISPAKKKYGSEPRIIANFCAPNFRKQLNIFVTSKWLTSQDLAETATRDRDRDREVPGGGAVKH